MRANPYFYDWGSPSARGIFQPAIFDDIRKEISSAEAAFSMRLFLVKAISGASSIALFEADLRDLVLDPKTAFAIRSAAAETLTAAQVSDNNWRDLLRALRDAGDDDSVRLAVEIIEAVGFHIASDTAIVDLVIANAGSERQVSGVIYPLEKALPDDRISCGTPGLEGREAAFSSGRT